MRLRESLADSIVLQSLVKPICSTNNKEIITNLLYPCTHGHVLTKKEIVQRVVIFHNLQVVKEYVRGHMQFNTCMYLEIPE